MAKCAYCGSETELFHGGVPICVKCSEEHEAKRKLPTVTRPGGIAEHCREPADD